MKYIKEFLKDRTVCPYCGKKAVGVCLEARYVSYLKLVDEEGNPKGKPLQVDIDTCEEQFFEDEPFYVCAECDEEISLFGRDDDELFDFLEEIEEKENLQEGELTNLLK